jgi:hypothetical protein
MNIGTYVVNVPETLAETFATSGTKKVSLRWSSKRDRCLFLQDDSPAL